ncbi:ABC transporter substrate-binding protein [Paenibacillus ginsengarvi]|uniref:Extracellular solute-binding protein n=1 Tax=Paenibacillus ginsengarvi TaxID=400777 RepID=A0A3B0CFF8_9BACL|nr:extracellular solute-binding protein [Paenibacillus ginsengarvi]RKN83831.1 extracellular solute-binding protein [Paenibacillus ginsengarvi]
MRKRGVMALVLLPLAAMLGACSQTNGATTDSSGAQTAESAPAVGKKEPVELIFYYPSGNDWTPDTFMSTFGEPIKKKFPHITPVFMQYGRGTSLPELLAAGQRIDVYFGSPGATRNLEDSKLQYDILPLIQKYKYDLNRLNPGLVSVAKALAHGGMNSLPVFVPPSAIYYNKDIFDKFGVAYPKDNMTWDDLYEISKKLTRTESGMPYLGLTAPVGTLIPLNPLSLPLVDPASEKANFQTDAWKSFITNFSRNFTLSGYDNDLKALDVGRQRDFFFKEQRAAMWISLTNLHKQPEITRALNWDIAALPTFKEAPGVGPQAYPTLFSIMPLTTHPDDAFEAIAYLTSDEFQMQQSRAGTLLPALKDPSFLQAFSQDSVLYKGKNVKSLVPAKYADSIPFTPYNGFGQTGLLTATIDYVIKQKDINTALREATDFTNQSIQTAKAGK